MCAGSALLLVALGFAAAHETRQLGAGEKATVTGAILSRDGDLIWVLDKKSSEIVVVKYSSILQDNGEDVKVVQELEPAAMSSSPDLQL